MEKLIDDHFPIVLVNRKLEKDKGDYVVLNNTYGAYLIVNHLIHLGYRRIGIIAGRQNVSTSADRYKGYMKALNDKGLEIDQDFIKQASFRRRPALSLPKAS